MSYVDLFVMLLTLVVLVLTFVYRGRWFLDLGCAMLFLNQALTPGFPVWVNGVFGLFMLRSLFMTVVDLQNPGGQS